MGCTNLCLTLLVLLSSCYAQSPCTLITPNVLRVESEETFVLDAQGHNAAFAADILVQDFPHKKLTLVQSKVSLNSANGFLGVVKAMITSKDLWNESKKKQYVYVSVRSPVCQMEKVVLLSFHSGYIFIQTDKPIYTPGSLVLYRVFAMNYKLQPVSKRVIIEFQTPDGIIVKRDSVDHNSGIISQKYKLPERLSLGKWTISAKYEDYPQQAYTNKFEVKEYVLPSFEVEVQPSQNLFYIDNEEFHVNIRARYLYGKHVDGKAFVLFGVQKDGVKTSIPESLRRVQLDEGEGEAKLERKDLLRRFQKPEDMLEYTLYVTVTVITSSGADMVKTELENIYIVKSPYRILFTKTSKYFKPGMPFDLTVLVISPDGSPVNQVEVVAEQGKVEGATQKDGTARLTLNTGTHMTSLQITAKMADPMLPESRQATAVMTALPYRPLGSVGNYLHIGIIGSEVKPGENIPINFFIWNTDLRVQNQIQQVTYLIMNKGRIMTVGRQSRQPGQPLVAMSLHITEDHIPSFRIVGYYIVTTGAGREVVSDSVWVDVADTCMGTPLGAINKLLTISILDAYENDEYMDTEDILTRTEFPESWLWTVEQMLERPDMNGISTKSLTVFLKDSITTWEVLAVSLSANKGICISQPYEITVMKDFFIDLRLPYSVVRNEQVEIRGILYNYGNYPMKVRVELTYNPMFCSLATSKKNFRQMVNIEPLSSVAVPFIIVPLTLGLHDVEVKAAVQNSFVSDGVRKKLKVVPEGMLFTRIIKSVILEPAVKGKDGVQEERIPALDAKNIVPWTEINTIVTIQGTPISRIVEDSVDGSKLNHLIIVPGGSGEQNMITMTSNVIATQYLDATGQWERIEVNRREQAINNIKTGYTHQLAFRKADNSYATWVARPANTWLTAYVVKIFGIAQSLVDIDINVVCGAIKWLILEKQKPDGLFQENAPVYQKEMLGGLRGSAEPDTVLTAFILIAILENQRTCTEQYLPPGIERASNYLLGQYQTLQKPYTIAITSYALAMAGKLQDTRKLLSASTENNHWSHDGSNVNTLEGTSYALLALLQMKEYDLAGPVVRWLTEKQFYGDVWGSTQATCMVFQALTQYETNVPLTDDAEMDIAIKLSELQQPLMYRINAHNGLLARSAETKINKPIVVTAKGKGQATLTVTSVYHAQVTEKESQCNNFDLSVTVKEEPLAKKPEDAKSTVSVTVCVKHLKPADASMSIIDITMMTGFSPDVEALNKLTKGVDRYISKFEINKGATDKGTLIIYLDSVSHTEEECLKFYAHQLFDVGLIQPADITVYDYYSPENRCTRFYHVDKDSALLGKICKDDVCRCAEDKCFMQQQVDVDITAEYRMEKACQPGVDFVYKTTLTKIEHNDNYDVYEMSIQSVIIEGTDKFLQGKTRSFISHAKCRKALNLNTGRDYLIWGTTADLWSQPSGYSYVLGRDTWVEWWPDERACQDPENQDICDDFLNFSNVMELNGCPKRRNHAVI